MEETKPSLYVTWSLVAVNCALFLFMAADGAGFFDTNGYVPMRWGSNFAPLTLSGDWWRLLSNVFIHYGIFHLGLNMYALASIGAYLEPLMGKVCYLTAYLCCGILASLASLWWHVPPVNSAGASGAIFGLYGIFFALLTTKLIPDAVRNSLLTNTAIFIGYNLIYGIKDGVDNAAHVGGLMSGMAIGYAFWLPLQVEQLRFMRGWIYPGIIAMTAAGVVIFLKAHPESQETRMEVLAELHEAGFPDFKQFNALLNQISEYDQKAIADLANKNMTANDFSTLLETVSYPAWDKAQGLLNEMENMQVSESAKQKVGLLRKYLKVRKKQAQLIEEYNRTNDSSLIPLMQKSSVVLNELQEKIRAL